MERMWCSNILNTSEYSSVDKFWNMLFPYTEGMCRANSKVHHGHSVSVQTHVHISAYAVCTYMIRCRKCTYIDREGIYMVL